MEQLTELSLVSRLSLYPAAVVHLAPRLPALKMGSARVSYVLMTESLAPR